MRLDQIRPDETNFEFPPQFTSITQEECGTGGCLLELSIQLAIIMIGKQFVGGGNLL